MYFLTELDPNVDVKGSRDPLGFQPIWTALGRHLVAHLTTVTTSMRGFSVLLLGLELTERVLEYKSGLNNDARERERLACFLRFEQLAAYSRYVTHEATDIRGSRRVKRRLAESGSKVTISQADRHQILGEQRTYGLWGLYMSAARSSGLVEEADARPTGSTRDHLDQVFVSALGKGSVAEIVKLIREDGATFEARGRHRAIARALGDALGPTRSDDERRFMTSALVTVHDDRDTTHGNQRLLWQAMRERSRVEGFDWNARCTCTDVAAFRDHAPEHGELAHALDAVIALEPLLATCEVLFGHLVGRRKVTRSAALGALDDTWGRGRFRHLRSDAVSQSGDTIARVAGTAAADRLGELLAGLRSDRFDDVLDQLLDQNDAVMRARGGAGWLDHSGSELRARLFQQPVALPSRASLPTLWRNSYFLDALRWIGSDIASLSRGAHGE